MTARADPAAPLKQPSYDSLVVNKSRFIVVIFAQIRGPEQVLAGEVAVELCLTLDLLRAIPVKCSSDRLDFMTVAAKVTQPIRPYGDRKDDGRIQLSFTLPVSASGRAKEAARSLCEQMGLQNIAVSTMEPAGDGFSFFVVYASTPLTVDFAQILVPEVTAPAWSFKEVNAIIRHHFGRKIVVVGACTGSDAHTVGIDAILNMKGYAGDKGLEAYPWVDAHNLGAQVDNAALLSRAKELSADAILVSQIVTQRDVHRENAKRMIDLARRLGLRDMQLILGGPRIDHKLARELGYDAGFGPGTKPSQVVSYIIQAMLAQRGIQPADALARALSH